MSVDLLREAAALMRQRGALATQGICPDWTYSAVRHIARNTEVECMEHGPNCAGEQWDRYNDHAHIASWHPAVAFAVADWLEVEAAGSWNAQSPAAVAVACAYLGRTS